MLSCIPLFCSTVFPIFAMAMLLDHSLLLISLYSQQLLHLLLVQDADRTDMLAPAIRLAPVSYWRKNIRHRSPCCVGHLALTSIISQRQKADRTIPKVTTFGLPKQKIITQFSHPLLAPCFMKRPMIPLTCNTAISNELATVIACHQFDVISFSDTAGGTIPRLACFSTCCIAALLSIFDHHIHIIAESTAEEDQLGIGR